MKERLCYLKDLIRDRQSNINIFAFVYFILTISIADHINLLGIKLYVALILAQLITWGSVVEKEHRYKMMKGYYDRFSDTEGSEKDIHKNSCKVLTYDKSIVESVIYAIFYAFPLVFSFMITYFNLDILGVGGHLFFILVTGEIVWIVFLLVNWSIISKEIRSK